MDMNSELNEQLAKLQWLLQRRHFKAHAAVGPMIDSGNILSGLSLEEQGDFGEYLTRVHVT
jgi:hypothetical protein